MAKKVGASYESMKIDGVPCYLVTPMRIGDHFKDCWLVHLHGGAIVFGGSEAALREAFWVAYGCNARVLSIDYRHLPVHPFPAAIEDSVKVWKAVTQKQEAAATALFGASAGGNLTLATTLELEEFGLLLPGALFVSTPATDLNKTDDTWLTLQGLDPPGQYEGFLGGTFEVYFP